MATATDPRLPPELCDRIIDQYQDDKRALSACSLVCKSWLPRSRSILFSATPDLSEHSVQVLDALLVSPHCTIIPFVRCIRFLPKWSARERDSFLDAFERSITRIQTAGGNLNKVEVAMVYPSELVGRPNLLLHLSQSVTSLSFMHFGFPMRIDTKSILEIMGVFSETLESLNLYLEIPGIITGSPLEPAPPFAQKVCMSQLRRLALSCPWNEVLPWFLLPGQVEFPRLTYLSVWMLFPIPDSRDLLQSFLDEKCANTVEDLELPCCYCYIPAIDLSQFTLRSIIFKGKNAGQVSEADCKKIVDIVSTASFAARKLTVVVTDDGFKLPSSNKDLDHVEWLIGSNLSETDEFEDMVLSVYRACFS
ncbi:hypothetical protein WG66_007874 [Moniliophthora roreri]|uniref:F-box domain-containing protein n=1 Tax=Moniliophthora roreri TaxID=221103 RepID=A0A0W0G2A2_MONRR|nr:hypothetical protein WG66_007874 [Moniliophthora roreri]